MKFSLVGQPYYYNCLDCRKELWTEGDRKIGVCLDCLAKRIAKAMREQKPVQFPWTNAGSN